MAHLTAVPLPARAHTFLDCVHCGEPTEAAHDATRTACGTCTMARLNTPLPLMPPLPVAHQKEFKTLPA